MPRRRRQQNRTSYAPPKQTGLYGKGLVSSVIWGAFVIPVGAMLIALFLGVQIDNAPLIILGLFIAMVIFGVCIAITEAIFRLITFDDPRKDKSAGSTFDDPRKDKPVESTLPPSPRDNLIDKDATYTLGSDGELMKVVDDEAVPPALSFKINDEDEQNLEI
jgi:hypothetical protein